MIKEHLRVIQFVNTVAHEDGGPARNSFELNLALNEIGGVKAALVALGGSRRPSVVSSFVDAGGLLPPIPPRWLTVATDNAKYMSLPRLGALIVASDAVIIHGYFLLWVPILGGLARLFGKPLFIMPHGALTPHELRKKRRKKLLFDRACRTLFRGGRVVFVTGSQRERDDLITRFGGGRYVEWAGVGTRLPEKEPRPRSLGSPLRLLTLSRIAPKKRIDLAIRALAILRGRGIEAVLDVAGAGPAAYVAELNNLATELGVNGSVRFRGMVTGEVKRRLLLSCDVFLLPSEDENFGIAVAEAAAHGLLVIASDRVAAAKLLSPSVCTLIASLDPRSLADAVQAATTKFKPTDRVVAAEDAARAYSWESVAGRWREIVYRYSK
ncbi:glycosyltransferase [Sinomonas halotolerans]|uniref:Glycosyltransferase n=1 Tax=Sinomonas halotolerans TaxID=1644133 RepID=A0ABU9WYM3_9MICC